MVKILKGYFLYGLLIMKISSLAFIILTLTAGTLLANKGHAQQLRDVQIHMSTPQLTLDEVLQSVQEQSGFTMMYNPKAIKSTRKVTLAANQQNAADLLTFLAENYALTIQQNGSYIYIKPLGTPAIISGTVTDESGISLPGASIRVEGSNQGAMANEQGQFSLSLQPGTYTVNVSYIGYQSRKFDHIVLSENQRYTLNPILKGMGVLKEVEVSYGQQRQREISGSIVDLDASSLQSMPVGQFAQQLQGKIAGVQVGQPNGQPGRGMEFRIRGAASLSSGNQPLFVIDGMPITGSINNINPAEIESYTILKDASASSLYGSRAANGVVLITTKHAKPGDSKVDFNSFYGIQKIPQKGIPKMMTAREFAEFQNEYFEDRVKYENYKGKLDPVYENPERYGEGTNWFDVLTRTAPIQNYDLTISSAREKSSSTVVMGYQNQQGVVINTGTQLFSLRFNQDLRLNNDKLKLGINFAPSYRLDHNNRLQTEGVGGLIQKASEASPLIAPIDENGEMPLYVNSPGMVANVNPYKQYMLTKDDYKTTRMLGNAYVNYEIIKGLSVKGNLGLDMGAETRNRFIPASITTSNVATGLSSSVNNYSYTAETYLNYNRRFGNHYLEALVGYSAQRFNQEGNSVTGINFPNDDVEWISAAPVISEGSSNTTAYSLLSTISRLNYQYKGKYLLSAAMRYDGSSRFGPDKRYGVFPSVSVGWVVSDEEFMKNWQAVELLKIRSSYGITGNNNIGNYTHISNIGNYNYIVNGTLTPGLTISSLGNPELGWERNKQFDIGLDLSLFQNRLAFTYDYYHKVSDGLIQNRPIPQASGFTSVTANIGVLKFWGHEFSVRSNNQFGQLTWSSSFNISFDRNRIQSLVSPGFLRRNNTISSDYYRNQEGQPLGMFYGFVFDGLYKDEADFANSAKHVSSSVGSIKMRDINNDGVIDDNDRTFIGDPNPSFLFGFTNDFSYKNFDLGIAINGSAGGKIITPSKWAYLTNLDGARMILAAAKDRWRSPENPGSGIYPRTMTGTTVMGRNVNSQWVENGSFLKVNNITLGYRFNIQNNNFLNQLRVYASVQNAFIITSYTGINPEVSLDGLNGTSIGIDENAYPVPRTYSLGLSLTIK